jgi:hypothetical protein
MKGDGADLVEAQYTGQKAALRPIYTALIEKLRALGPDVEITPKKTLVSVRRNKEFAILQPTSAARFDVGINLGEEPTTERLEAAGSFNRMVTHRVRLTSIKDVDDELVGWLRKAYELDK